MRLLAALLLNGSSSSSSANGDMDCHGPQALLRRTLPKLLPHPPGAHYPMEPDPPGQPPLAGAPEQLQLAQALLRAGVGAAAAGAGAVGCAADLEAVGSVLGGAAATLAALYERGVLPSGHGTGAAAAAMAGSSDGDGDGDAGIAGYRHVHATQCA